jgi:hypothetical protein
MRSLLVRYLSFADTNIGPIPPGAEGHAKLATRGVEFGLKVAIKAAGGCPDASTISCRSRTKAGVEALTLDPLMC